MRSDAAPALSQSIAPTWVQPHRWSNYVEFDEMAAPGTPAANRVRLYAKDKTGVSTLYYKKDNAAEVELAGGSVTGTGTTGKLTKWSNGAGGVLADSILSDDGVGALSYTDPATLFTATIDLQPSVQFGDQAFSLNEIGGGLGNLVTGSGLADYIPAFSAGGWGITNSILQMAVTGGQEYVYLAPDLSATTSGLVMFAFQLAQAMSYELGFTAGSGVVRHKIYEAGGKFLFVGNVAASVPVVEVTGGAKATWFNKITVTQPANGSTLTILDGKTFAVNKTLTLTGTDATTMTFPATSATIARTDAGNTFTGAQIVNGDLKLNTVGNGLYIKEGTDGTSGIVTLVAGVKVVSTTKVTATSRIYLTRQTVAGTVGTSVDVTARTAGTSFTITAAGSILDTSTVAWLIVEPA